MAHPDFDAGIGATVAGLFGLVSRHVHCSYSVPNSFCAYVYRFTPESPRYLVSKGLVRI